MLGIIRMGGLVSALLVGACAGVPGLDEISSAQATTDPNRRTEINVIVDQIRCEVGRARAVMQQRAQAAGQASEFEEFWVAYSLTVKISDEGALTPSVSVIHPLPAASTSESNTLGGAARRTRTRSFTHSGSFPVTDVGLCMEDVGRSDLTSDLGLTEVVATGISALNQLPRPAISSEASGSPKPPASYGGLGVPSFASTIEFVESGSINGGRQITRVRYRGPSGSNGLFALSRTDTNTLNIAFARGSGGAARALEEEVFRGFMRSP
jgi:hypothetical protein